jgi:hypothetical protein
MRTIFGQAVMYAPFNLLSEMLGNSVYQTESTSRALYMAPGVAALWAMVWAAGFLAAGYILRVRRDVIS